MAALAALNEMTDRPSGTFSFDGPPDKPGVQGYFLVEWDDARPLPSEYFARSICESKLGGTAPSAHPKSTWFQPSSSSSCSGCLGTFGENLGDMGSDGGKVSTPRVEK